MTENAGIARLWQGFHHLSENDKDLVLAVADTVGCLEQNTQAMPKQSGTFLKENTGGNRQGIVLVESIQNFGKR